MNKPLWACVVFGAIGFWSLIAFGLVGSSIQGQGFLHGPFFLVPVGWLSLFASGICLIASFASRA